MKKIKELFDMGVQFEISNSLLAQFQVKSQMVDDIKATQDQDLRLVKLKVQMGKAPSFNMEKRTLKLGNRLCVPNVNDL